MTEWGVRLAGIGSAYPAGVLTNHDLEKMMDTSHDWIVQRTGIHRRHVIDGETESEFTLARDALTRALDAADMKASDLDLIIHASVTSEMTCPSNACRIAAALGAGTAAAFDLVAACSGFVYAMNLADSLIRVGRHRAVGVIGCDALSTVSDFTERTVSILFGDGGGAAVFTRDDDPGRGCLHQELGADGTNWETLYMPRRDADVPAWDKENSIRLGCLRMNGREVFKFAVNRFRQVIEDALEVTGLGVDDVAQFVCHQSNERIIESAIQKLGLPRDRVHVNINEYGNTSAGSVGLVLDELWQAGKITPGDIIVCVAFGGGLTWASNVWRV
ncbi:MAG: ketoacyl-ACP synthase III [Phycisphaerales bacterium]|nr:ketoacyl-ACP synthase III [Phycisphaerae bacterium]NNM26249.1 ketoacyl-ACP synthase III [Phycisphaerales bacterium]